MGGITERISWGVDVLYVEPPLNLHIVSGSFPQDGRYDNALVLWNCSNGLMWMSAEVLYQTGKDTAPDDGR